jgi:hypothetical protein
MNRRTFLSGAVVGSAVASGVVWFPRIRGAESGQKQEQEQEQESNFENPTIAWETQPDMETYCEVRLDAENSTLGDADAVIVEDGTMEHRWSGGELPWPFSVKKPGSDGREYGGQIRAWAARGEWRKHLFVGRVNDDCELVEDPYGESLDYETETTEKADQKDAEY